EIAIQTAISRRGVAVVVIPGDVALRDAVEQLPRLLFAEPKPTVCPSDYEMSELADVLNRSKKITIFGGAGGAGAHSELVEVAGKLLFFFSSRRRHTRSLRDWSSDVCSSD